MAIYTTNYQQMRYCRVEFRGPGCYPQSQQVTLPVEFGYFGTEQKLETVKKLRKQYEDYSFVRCYSIPNPPPRNN